MVILLTGAIRIVLDAFYLPIAILIDVPCAHSKKAVFVDIDVVAGY